MDVTTANNDQLVSDAFSRQSPEFDNIYNGNYTTLWMRERVRQEVLKHISPGARMLELNCGTGIDSLFFAGKGFEVVSTDNADGMLNQLRDKIKRDNLQNIETAKCSFNNLQKLGKGKFDYVFSNFGGLNCTDKLYEVLAGIDAVLQPGGYFSLVIMPRVCPWEMLMVFKGYFKTAFRRFKRNGTDAHLEGVHFTCYYYNPAYVIQHAGAGYEPVSVKGLCITVPPPFIEQFKEKHPRTFRLLERIENMLWTKRPFNQWCDHYVITMRKKP